MIPKPINNQILKGLSKGRHRSWLTQERSKQVHLVPPLLKESLLRNSSWTYLPALPTILSHHSWRKIHSPLNWVRSGPHPLRTIASLWIRPKEYYPHLSTKMSSRLSSRWHSDWRLVNRNRIHESQRYSTILRWRRKAKKIRGSRPHKLLQFCLKLKMK